MGEQVRVEVPAELLVEHVQDVLVELCRHPGGVVVGRHQAPPVLDQVGAEEERVVARHGAVEVEEEPGPPGRVEVADGPAQEGDQAAALGGDRRQVLAEVADDQMDGQASYSSERVEAASRRNSSLTSKGT